MELQKRVNMITYLKTQNYYFEILFKLYFYVNLKKSVWTLDSKRMNQI